MTVLRRTIAGFKLIRQHDERDCGAACLSMIARHFGAKLSLAQARQLTFTNQEGANMLGLVTGANSIGLEAVGLRGELAELLRAVGDGDIASPYIAHVRENGMLHYVVVTRMGTRVVHIADPARGFRQMRLEEFSRIWTGHLVSFKRNNEPLVVEESRPGGFRYWSLLRGEYPWLLAVLLLSLAIASVGIAATFVFETVIDTLSDASEANASGISQVDIGFALSIPLSDQTTRVPVGSFLSVIFVSLISFYVFQAIIQYARGRILIFLSARIDQKLLPEYVDHIVDLPRSSVYLRKTGEYMSRLSDAALIRAAVSSISVSMIFDSIMVLGVGLVLYMQGGSLFWVALVVVAFYLVLLFIFRRPLEARSREAMERDAVSQSYIKEAIDGFDAIKTLGAGCEVKASARDKLSTQITANAKEGLLAVSQETITEAVQSVGIAAVLWLGFSSVASGEMSVGSLVTFYALLGMFIQPVKNLVDLQPIIQSAFVAASRLDDIFSLETEDTHVGSKIYRPVNTWTLDDVVFQYGNRESILGGISLEVSRGEKIAIVGESGSGKTSLARLLVRLYEPTEGRILLDGESANQYSLDEYRRIVSHVDQTPFLFADSIFNNLRLGSPEAGLDQVRTACEIACADDFISSFPMGYDTGVDENGGNLSGGQRQRLMIARSLLREPQLLVLDEATSNLDLVTESRVWTNLFGLDNLALVIVAHRLASVRECDRVYVLKSGKLVEHGRHDDLIRLGGEYARLWTAQEQGLTSLADLYASSSD